MALSKVDLANQVENILPETLGGTGASQFPAQFRNIIINGDMNIAQRSTSVAGITATAYNTMDRWRFNINGGSMGTWTMSQSTDVPSGQGFAKSLKLDCTTADASPTASEFLNIEQRFEGQMLQYLKKGTANAESLTLSFWVKSNKTGTYIAEIIDTDNDRNNVNAYTINSANTWEKKTITISGDTTGTLDNDNLVSMRASFYLGAGSDYTSGSLQSGWATRNNANRLVGQVNLADSTANEWYITGVQLEAGTTASDFEFLPFDVNLQRCRRYYETNFNIGTTPAEGLNHTLAGHYADLGAFTTNAARVTHFYKVTKRATPTITFYNVTSLGAGTTTGKWQIYDGGWSEATGLVSAVEGRLDSITVQVEDSYNTHEIYLVGGGLAADAEL